LRLNSRQKRAARTGGTLIGSVAAFTMGGAAQAQVKQSSAGPMPTPAPVAGPQDAPMPSRLNPTGRDIRLSAPLRDGAFVLGDVPFLLTRDDQVLVNGARFLAAVRPVIDPQKYSELALTLDNVSEVPLDRFAALGFVVSYDPQAIGLTVAIPASARSTRQLRLAQIGDDLVGSVDRPARVSAYVNLRGSADYAWQGANKGLQDPLILTDAAFRIGGVVLETEGTFQVGTQTGSKTVYRREGTRLVYDSQKYLARITAGDLLPASRGFSGSSQIAGVGVTRSYAVLEPQRNVQPRGDRTFTLNRPSTVEAFINGQPVRQVRLDPGTYNVRDFPFTQGTNDVRLVITDDAGTRETVEFSLFFDRTLLAPGLTEFGLYAGVLAPFTGRGRDYRVNKPAANGFIRRGISQRFTGGLNFQVQQRGVVAGVEGVYASPIGTLGFDLAASKVAGIGTGYALNVGLQRTLGGSKSRGQAIALTFETRSRNFALPNDLTADNRFVYEIGGTYSRSIGELQFVSLNARFSKGRDGRPDEKSARLSYGYRINSNFNLQAEGIYEDRALARKSYGARISLTYRLGERSTATAEYDTRSGRARVGYQSSQGSGVGATSYAANVDYGRGSLGLDGALAYTANRAEVAVSHATIFDSSGLKISDQRTSLRLGTALVFADGHVALSRPIFDGFALVVPHKSLRGGRVVVDPREDRYTARSDVFGGAVAPDLSSYSDRSISFDVPNAPVGYDLGAGNVRVYPPYRAGYLVTVGSDYSVTAVGRMTDGDGAAISLLAGEARELAKPNAPATTVFTNRDGRFGLQGLRPGKWQIIMPTEPPTALTINIPKGANGVVRLGDLKLEGMQ
jgi:outer membrane usher protein